MIGNLVGGWLTHRGAGIWLMVAIASAVMGLTALGIYGSALPEWGRYGLVLVFCTVGGLLPAAVLGGAASLAPKPTLVATATGMIQQSSNTAMLLGPPLAAGLVAAGGGWHVTPWLVTSSAGVGILLAFWLRRVERALSKDRSHEP